MADKAGFVIDGTKYEFPTRMRLGDWVLIREVTGLESGEFAELIDTTKATDRGAPVSLGPVIGLLAVGIWQANPRWTREKVVRYVNDIDFQDVEMVDGDDADPPTMEAQGLPPSRSGDTSNESTTTAAASLEEDPF